MSDQATAPVADAGAPQEVGQQEGQPQQTAAQKQAEQRYKVKVKGQEREYTIDEMRKATEKVYAADETFQSAAKLRKEATELMDKLKKDPHYFVKHPEYGPVMRQAVEDMIYEEIEMKNLTPEQRELRQLKREKEQADKDKAAREETEKTEKQQQLKLKYAQEFDRFIGDALNKSDLPKTPGTVMRMASYMDYAIKNGISFDHQDVVDVVYEDYVQEFAAMISGARGKGKEFHKRLLMKILDDDTRKALREADLETVRTKAGERFGTPRNQPAPSKEKKPVKKLSGNDWRSDTIKGYLGK